MVVYTEPEESVVMSTIPDMVSSDPSVWVEVHIVKYEVKPKSDDAVWPGNVDVDV